MEKERANANGADKISFGRILLELTKAALTGVVRAVASHWLNQH